VILPVSEKDTHAGFEFKVGPMLIRAKPQPRVPALGLASVLGTSTVWSEELFVKSKVFMLSWIGFQVGMGVLAHVKVSIV